MSSSMTNARRGVPIALIAMFTTAAALGADTQSTSEVTVQAERPASKVVGRSSSGMPILLGSVQYRVSYTDLDLSIASNATVLKTRVRDAARDACADLTKLAAISVGGSNECSARAEERAMPQVLAAIAAAESRKTAAD